MIRATAPRPAVLRDCSGCDGEGWLLAQGRPGVFSRAHGAWVPSESWLECPECAGSGQLEVCPDCREPWRAVDGLEVCGCQRLAWPRAA